VRNPTTNSNATPSVLFRLIEEQQITLLLDETDTFIVGNEQMRGIIDGAHRRRTAFVLRNEAVDGSFKPRRFSTWCPKVFAGINRLDPTLESRSIIVPMRRKDSNRDVPEMQADRFFDEQAPLRERVERWAEKHMKALREAGTGHI